jgi:hypothetical protein
MAPIKAFPHQEVQAIVGSHATEPPDRISFTPIFSNAWTDSSLALVPLYRPHAPGRSETYPTETASLPPLLVRVS